MKIVVEVHDASDLMPKDGQGSANPFVEVDFDQQRQRTLTKTKDLNPVWNEKLQFNVSDPNNLPNQTLDVAVFNERKGGHHKNFLGRVRISGVSIPLSESESAVQRFPLDKRGIFSHIRGDIALKIYAVSNHPLNNGLEQPIAQPSEPNINGSKHGEEQMHKGGNDKGKNRSKNKSKDTQSWYSVPPSSAPSGLDFLKPAAQTGEEKRTDYARVEHAVPVTVHHMAVPFPKQPEFGLVETSPPLPGRLYGHRRDKTSTTYDLVEQMHYLYVSVIKAKDLPVMDITGGLDPYVELKIGNYKGITKHFEKNQNPER